MVASGSMALDAIASSKEMVNLMTSSSTMRETTSSSMSASCHLPSLAASTSRFYCASQPHLLLSNLTPGKSSRPITQRHLSHSPSALATFSTRLCSSQSTPRRRFMEPSTSPWKCATSVSVACRALSHSASLVFVDTKDNLVIGTCSGTGTDDIKKLVEELGITAFISLETDDEYSQRGASWPTFAAKLEELGVAPVRIEMREGDGEEQARVLPEAVRITAAMLRCGQRVFLHSAPNSQRGPLVWLTCYLWLEKLRPDEAWAQLKQKLPNANPDMEIITKAREKVMAGEGDRVIKIAERVYFQRVETGEEGDSNSDWENAQRIYVEEEMHRRVSLEENLAKSVAQAIQRKAEANLQMTEGKVAKSKATGAAVESALARANGAVKLANSKITQLQRQVDQLTKEKNLVVSEAERYDEKLKGLTKQVELMKRKETLYNEAMSAANERIKLLTDQINEQQTGPAPPGGSPPAAERGRVSAAEARLKREVELAQASAREQAVVAKVAEGKLSDAKQRIKELEDERRGLEEGQRRMEEELSAWRNKMEMIESSKKMADELAKVTNDRIVLLTSQVQDLQKRLRTATEAATGGSTRIQFLERQVEELLSKGAMEKTDKRAAKDAVKSLTSQLAEAEKRAEEASRNLDQISKELKETKKKEEFLSAAVTANTERSRSLSTQVEKLRDSEAKARARAEELEKDKTIVEALNAEVTRRTNLFVESIESLAKKGARLNAELAFAEGRADEVEAEMRATLGAASETLSELGLDAAVVAAERSVEIEIEPVKGKPGKLLRVLTERISTDLEMVVMRASRVLGEVNRLRVQTTVAEERGITPNEIQLEEQLNSLKDFISAQEDMNAAEKEDLLRRLGGLQRSLFLAILAVFGIPALVIWSVSGDPVFQRLKSLEEQLMSQMELEAMLEEQKEVEEDLRKELQRLIKVETTAGATTATLEEVLQAQADSVSQLQSLIPLVAPSLRSPQAAEFCRNVPEKYWSAVTARFCETVLRPIPDLSQFKTIKK